MSSNLISRQAVLAIANDSCLDLDKWEDNELFCKEIKELPSVDITECARAIKKYCDRQKCDKCTFKSKDPMYICSLFHEVPCFWDLPESEDKPTYSVPEREKGEWIKDGSVYRCSRCNHYPMGNIASEKFEDLSRLDTFYFCPHCGVDIRGKAE